MCGVLGESSLPSFRQFWGSSLPYFFSSLASLAGLSLFAGSGNFFHFNAMDFWLVFARF